MATAVTSDIYLQQIHTARTQLLECFRRAHELLVERESHLLRELENIQNDYESKTNSQKVELQVLEASKQALENNLRNNYTLDKALASINEQMDVNLNLSSGTARTIRFQWNIVLDRDLQHAGDIITTNQANQSANLTPTIPPPANHYTPDYKNKSTPVITCCKHKGDKSASPGGLHLPRGLAVEPKSGRIYIVDYGNDRVQVFTPNGEFSFMFNSNMNGPYGICINNDTVYVSQSWGDCIVLYKLNGAYVNKVGSHGTNNGQFDGARGLTVSPATGHIYVCDRNNDRVQVFNKKLKFNSMFANNKVNKPSDVKLTQHLVLVLDGGNPCIHIFNITDLSLLRSIISRGDKKQANVPEFFAFDSDLNILLTDYVKHCVCVFSQSGKLITQFGKLGHSAGDFFRPTGIAIYNQNRIVVVSQNKNNALQLF